MTTDAPTRNLLAPSETEAPRHKRNTTAFWLLFPGLALLAAIIGYPIVRAIYLSLFTEDSRGTDTDVWAGFANYRRALFGTDAHDFWSSIGVTLFFAATTVVTEVVIGVLLAFMMNRAFHGRALVRASILVPWAIPTAVSALLWQWMFQPEGIVNAIIGHQVLWTGSTWPSRFAIIIADTWKTAPFVSLLVLASMQSIPKELYEAARVDGATTWQRTWRITLPLVKPALAVAALFRVLDALRMYDLPAILTHGSNGTTTVSLFAYQQALNQGKFGYGSALSTLTFLLVFVVGFGFVRVLSERLVEASGPVSS